MDAFNVTLAITASSLIDQNTNNNTASITLTAVPGYTISGLVADCSSTPLTNITIILAAANLANQTTATSTNGTYQFASLLSGTYSLSASNANYTFAPSNAVETDVGVFVLTDDANEDAIFGKLLRNCGRDKGAPHGVPPAVKFSGVYGYGPTRADNDQGGRRYCPEHPVQRCQTLRGQREVGHSPAAGAEFAQHRISRRAAALA